MISHSTTVVRKKGSPASTAQAVRAEGCRSQARRTAIQATAITQERASTPAYPAEAA